MMHDRTATASAVTAATASAVTASTAFTVTSATASTVAITMSLASTHFRDQALQGSDTLTRGSSRRAMRGYLMNHLTTGGSTARTAV